MDYQQLAQIKQGRRTGRATSWDTSGCNAYFHNGSSVYEHDTGGYQTSYVFHLENPVRFTESIRVTIEHGHGNHLANDYASVAYWYARQPTKVLAPPSVAQRMPVPKDNQGNWLRDRVLQTSRHTVTPTDEMTEIRRQYGRRL